MDISTFYILRSPVVTLNLKQYGTAWDARTSSMKLGQHHMIAITQWTRAIQSEKKWEKVEKLRKIGEHWEKLRTIEKNKENLTWQYIFVY